MSDDHALPLGDDPRDAFLTIGTIHHLAALRRIDRTTYENRLMAERATVDRQSQAAERTQVGEDRRADQLVANAGILDADDAVFDADTRDRLRALRRTDAVAWAVAFG